MMFVLVTVLIILAIDLYTFKGINVLYSKTMPIRLKKIINYLFWTISGLMIILIIAGFFLRSLIRNGDLFIAYFYFFGVFLVIYIPKILFVTFHLLEDILYSFKWIFKKFSPAIDIHTNIGTPISRSKFITQIGLVLAAVPFISLIGGILKGRFDFRVEHLKLSFPDLPKSFHGLKIVQVSDIHIGSFKGFERQVEEAITMVNAQNGDYLLFTGDLVNNFYDELENDWIPILSKMKAKLGKFSILGNHDYGNYFHWNSEKDKQANFQNIIDANAKIGFRLLKNESVTLTNGDEKIALIGVENWGHLPFPQLADYEKASKNVSEIPFKILMSHDPTHWDAKILNKEKVQLTLSGHTHGMQFGIKLGNYRWSPASFRYPRWAGLYKEGQQYLYVNRGFGYIGYPGRVGMPPEITVIELYRS